MADHLVLVVHGVGEQKPGETVDQVLGGALAEHERLGNGRLEVTGGVLPLPEESFPEVRQRSAEDGRDHRQSQIFPVHYRRIRCAGGKDAPQTVLAEVYWADKSPAPRGAMRTVLDFLRVLLGIGYLAMDNAENTRGRASFVTVHGFTWTFFGGIAPLNALMLIGALLLLLEGHLYSLDPAGPGLHFSGPWVLAGVGGMAAGLGGWILARASTYMVRLFGMGLAASAAVPVMVALVTSVPALRGWLDMAPHGAEVEMFVVVMQLLMGAVWALAVALAVLVCGVSLIDGARTPKDGVQGQRRIYAPICAAMILLWMVVASAFWLVFRRFAESLNMTPTDFPGHVHKPHGFLAEAFASHLENSQGTMTVSVLGFAILLVVVAVVLGLRAVFRQALYEKTEWISRLLLNRAFQLAMLFALALIAVTVGFLVERAMTDSLFWFKWVEAPYQALARYTALVSTVLLVLGGLFYASADKVSGVLGIVRDIVAYAIMGRCNWSDTEAGNYPVREGIENRFLRVYGHLAGLMQPDKLTVLSHSQGTVVATRCLRRMKAGGTAIPEDSTLVTMGSPVMHIYRRYFPRDFAVTDADGNVNVGDVKIWHNIFRADDFAGTRNEVLELNVTDHPVGAGGHTGYFTDAQVWQKISDKVGFRLVQPRGGAIGG